MAKMILRHRNFHLFRSIVATWDPMSCQPIASVWDVQPWTVCEALLQMRDKLHFRTVGSPFHRRTAYALSVLIQAERLESYIIHKACLTLADDDDDSSRFGLTVPNVNRLALEFSHAPYETLAVKCFGWVNSQLNKKLFDDANPIDARIEDAWNLARSLQHVVFPHYIRYALWCTSALHPAEQFLDIYERASSCTVTEWTSPERVRLDEKFYLVNMANPDKQGDKFRFREQCNVFDQLKEWKRIAYQIGHFDDDDDEDDSR